MEQIVKLTSANPAEILGIEGGAIKDGMTADITIFDPSESYEFKAERHGVQR